jgi:hypothetical protein
MQMKKTKWMRCIFDASKTPLLLFTISLTGLANSNTNPNLPISTKGDGFQKGALFVNAGILYGCGAFGGEVEFGVHNSLGLQIGAGLLGLNAGPILHIHSTQRNDITLGLLAGYLSGINAVVPEVNLGYRFFPGQASRVGIAMRCGIAISTTDTQINDGNIVIQFKRGRPFLTYAVGVTVKAIRGARTK